MKNLLFLSLIIILAPSNSFGQQKDFGTWSYFNAQLKLTEKWSVGYADHQITHENATEKWMLFHDFFIAQKIGKHLTQECHIRWIQFQKLNNQLEDRSLFYYAMNGNLSFQDWTLSMRSRWQLLTYGNHWLDDYKGPFFYHRMRLSLGKRWNYHWKSNISIESFQPLNRPDRKGFDQFRIGPDLSYRINKNWTFDLFYQYQKQLQRKNPYTYYLIGIGINLTL